MDYDLPMFKRLARNDTSAAPGHQGDIVIPKDLAAYFPKLAGTVSADSPTLEAEIEAELFVDGRFKGKVTCRYQCQTWGGKRSAEWRLTANLAPIRDAASADDLLIFERSMDDPAKMRLTLVTQTSENFAAQATGIGQKRWGFFNGTPVSNDEIAAAAEEEEATELAPFTLLATHVARTQSRSRRIARDQAFRQRIMGLYDHKCAVTGRSMFSPKNASGIDGAHIIPLEFGGTNDARNGIALAKDIHWAFDRGLIGINDERRLILSPFALEDVRNCYLQGLAGVAVAAAKEARLDAHPDAIRWHRENVFSK